MKREKSPGGAEAFESWYAAVYGERWPALRAALLGESPQVALRVLDGGGFELTSAAAGAASGAAAGTPGEGPSPYFLDPASVDAALALELPASGQVLDACAAPGGKSLVLAARLGPEARLLSNELSADRRRRLGLVLDASLPMETRARVSVFGADASSLCLRRKDAFDAILLDAPCSSERHVLADPAALAAWTPSRPKALAVRQWALLSSAWIMLAPGGCLVYSTCSINPAENDGVAERLVRKHGALLGVERPALEGGEETEYGCLVLPDRAAGRGPMYAFRIRKIGV